MLPGPARFASLWDSTNVVHAPADGPVAFGDDLRPHTLFSAYRKGLYPFPAGSVEQQIVNEMTYADAIACGSVALLPHSSNPFAVAWCSPDPRPVIFARKTRLQRSLRRQLRREKSWVTTVDACFDRVVDRCRARRTEQWLTDTLAASLSRLHQCGLAHSVEVWDGTELIGGAFGLQLGAVFSADSQFTERSGAGKAAVVALSDRFARAGGVAIDVQHDSAHVQLLGAQPISRAHYLSLLRSPIRTSPLDCQPEPVQRLAD